MKQHLESDSPLEKKIQVSQYSSISLTIYLYATLQVVTVAEGSVTNK